MLTLFLYSIHVKQSKDRLKEELPHSEILDYENPRDSKRGNIIRFPFGRGACSEANSSNRKVFNIFNFTFKPKVKENGEVKGPDTCFPAHISILEPLMFCGNWRT